MSGAKNNTATATTATVDYVGRFAPTPSGPLHLGSLVAALASFLDARAAGGRWLLRIDDLDGPRVRPGSAAQIIRQLTNLGLGWDGAIRYQSAARHEYRSALEQIQRQGVCFYCNCSRRMLRAAIKTDNPDDSEPDCIAGCRDKVIQPPATLRLDLTRLAPSGFLDRWQGHMAAGGRSPRDRVLQRRDGIHAYHLAVVVDDLATGVTDVVRGADLLTSTLVQLGVYRKLSASAPRYAHAPVVMAANGAKLSKSQHSLAVGEDASRAGPELTQALRLLRQIVPVDLDRVQVKEILDHAIHHWNPTTFSGVQSVRASR